MIVVDVQYVEVLPDFKHRRRRAGDLVITYNRLHYNESGRHMVGPSKMYSTAVQLESSCGRWPEI